jgi:hypothetical protein
MAKAHRKAEVVNLKVSWRFQPLRSYSLEVPVVSREEHTVISAI